MTPPLHRDMGTFNLSNGKQQKVQLLKCFYLFIFTSAPQNTKENINILMMFTFLSQGCSYMLLLRLKLKL